MKKYFIYQPAEPIIKEATEWCAKMDRQDIEREASWLGVSTLDIETHTLKKNIRLQDGKAVTYERYPMFNYDGKVRMFKFPGRGCRVEGRVITVDREIYSQILSRAVHVVFHSSHLRSVDILVNWTGQGVHKMTTWVSDVSEEGLPLNPKYLRKFTGQVDSPKRKPKDDSKISDRDLAHLEEIHRRESNRQIPAYISPSWTINGEWSIPTPAAYTNTYTPTHETTVLRHTEPEPNPGDEDWTTLL